MKRIALTLGFLLSVLGSSYAQSNKEDVAIIQNLIGKEKKELIAGMVHVDEAHAEKFWKLYDEYEKQRKSIGADRIRNLEQYAASYKTLTDEQAKDLMNSSLSSSIAMDKLQKKYFKKFSSEIGAMQAAQLMQVENYLKNAIQLKVLSEVPFINDMVRK